jgi:hypothetical protein
MKSYLYISLLSCFLILRHMIMCILMMVFVRLINTFTNADTSRRCTSRLNIQRLEEYTTAKLLVRIHFTLTLWYVMFASGSRNRVFSVSLIPLSYYSNNFMKSLSTIIWTNQITDYNLRGCQMKGRHVMKSVTDSDFGMP